MVTSSEQSQPGQEPGAGPRSGNWQSKVDAFAESCKTTLLKAEERLRTELKDAVPPEARTHFSKSKREFLIGIREVIDRQIQKQPPDSQTK